MADVINEEARREEAKRALEGAERTAKREQEEQTKRLESQLGTLEQRLAEIAKEKERLELAWIDLDTKKKGIRAVLNPLLDEEKKIEEEETKLEAEESSIGVPENRHEVEKKRWAVQERRKEIEQKKWAEEEKIVALDQTIAANTKAYRTLLDEEDKLNTEVQKLKTQAV